MGERMFVQWSWSHDQDGRHANYILKKPFKNLLLQNQKADDLGTWYVALGCGAYQVCSNDDPRTKVDLDLLNVKVKFAS